MARKIRIVYAAGPGNIIETFGYWSKGQDDPSQVSITFSGQFYDVCSNLNAEGYIISSNSEKKFLKQDSFTLEHRPILLSKQSGVLYYLGQILYELSVVISALQFRADVVVGSSTSCFFVLSLLPKLGIQAIPSLHCVLWPRYGSQSKVAKLLWKLNRNFFAKDCLAILSTSEDINEQVRQVTHNQPRPIFNFLSTYRRIEFENVAAPSKDRSIFQVLFAGRIEVKKGVFDLLEIAKQFKREGRDNIKFNVCGTGSAFKSLCKQAEEFELQSSFILRGYCNKPEMQKMFSLSHVVIVPTKSDFVEGLNQVVIEGILANRPVITSSVCPALTYVQEAVLEVLPDDIAAYANAILKLYDDYDFYEMKQQNCSKLQEKFYDASQGWGGVLESIFKKFQIDSQ
jgi:glycogen(starch) synthase